MEELVKKWILDKWLDTDDNGLVKIGKRTYLELHSMLGSLLENPSEDNEAANQYEEEERTQKAQQLKTSLPQIILH